jgi:hypothetical protein
LILKGSDDGVTHRITGFFGLFASSGLLENTTFRKLDLFPSSGEGGLEDTYSVGPLRETNPVSETSCSLGYQTIEKSKNPVIL